MPKKHTIEFARECFAQQGCRLLDTTYISSTHKMTYVCKCGRTSTIPLQQFRKKPQCQQCGLDKMASKSRHSIDHVRNYFQDQGCVLLETEYKRNDQYLRYICSCGNESKIIFNSFQQGARCKKCANKRNGDRKRLDFDFVKQEFERFGCTLLETTYANANTPLRYVCKCGHESKIRYDSFQQGQRCKACCGKPTITLEFLREYFHEQDCELLSSEYKTNITPLTYRCQCGTIANTKWMHFSRGHRCKTCKIQKLSGSNAPNWNPDRTDEDRHDRRQYPEYAAWRSSVFERDDYTCQMCCKRGGQLVAHHLNSYRAYPEQRIDITNGVTLCCACHNSFHTQYGTHNNTKKQFDEFSERL